jgi:uncharacterized membrane protein required for colicin V production
MLYGMVRMLSGMISMLCGMFILLCGMIRLLRYMFWILRYMIRIIHGMIRMLHVMIRMLHGMLMLRCMIWMLHGMFRMLRSMILGTVTSYIIWRLHYESPMLCDATLKVLSSPARWIQPKLGSLDRSSLKREARKVFRKIHLPPILWSVRAPHFLIYNYATI